MMRQQQQQQAAAGAGAGGGVAGRQAGRQATISISTYHMIQSIAYHPNRPSRGLAIIILLIFSIDRGAVAMI